MSNLHLWVVFFHVAGVLGFLVAHGASTAVVLRLRTERDPAAVRTLLDLSSRSILAMSIALLVWLIAGVIAGFTGNGGAGWWTSGRYWIWASLALSIVIVAVMTPMGRTYLNKVRAAVGIDPKTGAFDATHQVDPQALDAAISSGRPMFLATIGVGGVIVLAWLMMFRPF